MQFWLAITLMILLGLLGAYPALVKAQPNAKDVLDKLTPIQGIVGLIGLVWGIWWLIRAVLNLNILGLAPLFWLTWLVSALVMMLLGFLLSFGLLQQIGVMGGSAGKTGEQIRAKTVGYQVPLGFTALGLVVWYLIVRYVIY